MWQTYYIFAYAYIILHLKWIKIYWYLGAGTHPPKFKITIFSNKFILKNRKKNKEAGSISNVFWKLSINAQTNKVSVEIALWNNKSILLRQRQQFRCFIRLGNYCGFCTLALRFQNHLSYKIRTLLKYLQKQNSMQSVISKEKV